MARQAVRKERIFKTAWFLKAARKAHLSDEELCAAITQVMLGQADDLGGGVYKKRLGKNLYRSIVLARAGNYWVYEFLFAKQDQANMTDDQLLSLRKIAKGYANLTSDQVEQLQQDKYWTEICHADEAEV